MFGKIGAGSDDGDFAPADDIGLGAAKGERRWIGREKPPHEQHRILDDPCRPVFHGPHVASPPPKGKKRRAGSVAIALFLPLLGFVQGALPLPPGVAQGVLAFPRSEEHTPDLQSLMRIPYALF